MNATRMPGRRSDRPFFDKHHAIRRWVQRCLGTIRHEDRVAKIAEELFDLTWPLHQLTPANRRLLQLAAIVHDVGRCIDDESHPHEGARMLLDEQNQLPLTSRDRRLLAYLTRHHRGKVPDGGCDQILHADDDHARLLLILAILRAADALDSRSLESPRLVFSLQGHRLRVGCYLEDDCVKARRVYERRKKFRLLEELLDCRVDVAVRFSHGLRLVA